MTLRKDLLKHVRQQNSAEIQKRFAVLAQQSGPAFPMSTNLRKIFDKTGQRSLLLDLIFEHAEKLFGSLTEVFTALDIAFEEGRFDELAAEIARLQTLPSWHPPFWAEFDLATRFSRSSREVGQLATKIKYAGAQDSYASFDIATRALRNRVFIPRRTIERLYKARGPSGMDSKEFGSRLREGFCFAHLAEDSILMGDQQLQPMVPDFGKFAHGKFRRNIRSLFDDTTQEKGIIALTFHGGILFGAKQAFHFQFPDGKRLGSGRVIKDDFISTAEDGGRALFSALRVLQGGGQILMAPDGPQGTKTSFIEVSGLQVPVADGAVFLAYESRCNVVWLSAERAGNTIVPKLVHGPSREGSETYNEYRERLLAFYAERIEAYLASPPENIALKKLWVGILNQ